MAVNLNATLNLDSEIFLLDLNFLHLLPTSSTIFTMSYSAHRSGFNLVSTLSPSVLCQWSGRAASAKHISSHPSIHCFSRTRNARQALRSIPKHPYASLLARTASTATYITKPAKPIAPPVARPPPSLSKPVNSSPSAPSKPSPAASTPTAAAFPPQTDLSDPKTQKSLTNGLYDDPETLDTEENKVDWSRSFHGLSQTPFSKEAADVLLQPVAADDIEIKPDGIVYLPEIKYRRILNRAFGPGAWGLAPRGETIVTPKTVTREYGLVVHGR